MPACNFYKKTKKAKKNPGCWNDKTYHGTKGPQGTTPTEGFCRIIIHARAFESKGAKQKVAPLLWSSELSSASCGVCWMPFLSNHSSNSTHPHTAAAAAATWPFPSLPFQWQMCYCCSLSFLLLATACIPQSWPEGTWQQSISKGRK